MEDKYVIALGAAKNMLAKIVYTKKVEDGRDTESFIGELDYLREGYIGIELPYNTETKQINCGGKGTTVASVEITPVTEMEHKIWLELAIKFIEGGREYDKWDRSISFSGYDYIQECKYVDAHADGRLKHVKSLELYEGGKLEI